LRRRPRRCTARNPACLLSNELNPETQTIFERLILERGLVTPDQLAAARRLQAESSTKGGPARTLLEVLTQQGWGDRAGLRDMAHLAAIRSGAERISLGGFELLEKIGQGGMGAVYRASQVNMGRFVALKLMRPKLARDKRYLERFLREARASAKLSHPNIVEGIDAGRDKGYYYFAMEFVDGDSLRRIIDREGPLPEQRCIEIGIQMARALEHAAKFGMVHRDVKPENILVEHDTGVAKLADLGLIKSSAAADMSVTQMGVALGTPNYISPEQAKGEENIDIRSDIYSLGATLYHAATGTLPFDGKSAPVVLSQHLSAPLDPPQHRNPELSIRFSRVIQKMMAKKPEHRYQTPTELIAEFERISRGEQPRAVQSKAQRRRRPETSAPFRKPRLAAAVIGGSLAAVLVLGIVLVYVLADRTDWQSAQAGALYQKAAELVTTQPTNFADIARNLRRCIELDPQGPYANAARELLNTAESFQAHVDRAEAVLTTAATLRGFTRRLGKGEESWANAIRGMAETAAKAPSHPPYAESIRHYIRTASHKLMAHLMRHAVSEPTAVPRVAKWLDAMAAAAPDGMLADECKEKKLRLAGILHDNADHILDRFASKAEELAAKTGRFGAAIDALRSSIPKALMTKRLEALIEKRVQVTLEHAARHVEKRREYVWVLLDNDALERARAQAEQLKKNLGVPALQPQADALCRTTDAAGDFLPLFAKLKELDAATPKDLEAIGTAALELKKRFGKDPYVADRLKKYAGAIDRLTADKKVSKKLRAAEDLLAAGKYDQADAAICDILRDSASTAAQRARATALYAKLPPSYGLIRALKAAFAAVPLPAQNVPLRFKPGSEPTPCTITKVSDKTLTYETKTGRAETAWSALGHQALYDLALGKLRLVKDDDPAALYCLGACCYKEQEIAEARRLLSAALELARKRTDAQLPGRAALVASAQAMLRTIADAGAQKELRQLGQLVRRVKTSRDLDDAVRAWDSFRKKHSDADYLKANAAVLGKIGAELSDAIVRIRTGSIMKSIARAEWAKIVARLQQVLDETGRIAPLPAARRTAMERLLRFGRDYLVEEIIHREAFAVRPWRGLRLIRLKTHGDPRVAKRALQYGKIFDISVECQANAAEQRRYAMRETRGEKTVPVRDVATRLARLNAVFTHWPKERDDCAWAEVEAAREFRRTGPGGNIMTIIMMDAFLKFRRTAPKSARGQAEYERLQAYIQSAPKIPMFRTFVIQKAKQLMTEYRGTGDFPARFCLVVAEQYEAQGDDPNALKYFKKLIDPRSKFKNYAWHGFLGRGRIYERRKMYPEALADYDAALKRSSGWHDGLRCARAIVNLCVHSGKLNKPAHAEKAVDEVIRRASQPEQIDRTRGLLKKK